MFSIKTSEDRRHKIIKILGIKIKFKRNKIKVLNDTLKRENNNLSTQIRFVCEENISLLKNCSRFIQSAAGKKVYLLNDTRREDCHLGCSIVVKNIEQLLKSIGCEIVFYDATSPISNINTSNYREIINACDFVLFNGEGSLHDDHGQQMYEKCKIAKELNKKVHLINSVWQNNKQVEKYLNLFDTISLRETASYNELPDEFKKKALVIGDLSLWGDKKDGNGNKVKKLIFTDSCVLNTAKELLRLSEKYGGEFYFMYPFLNEFEGIERKYLDENLFANLSSDSLIVTGRFHALTLAIKYKIPTLAIPSNTHKVEGLLHDAGLSDFLVSDLSKLEDKIIEFKNRNNEDFIKKATLYHDDTQMKIQNLFTAKIRGESDVLSRV